MITNQNWFSIIIQNFEINNQYFETINLYFEIDNKNFETIITINFFNWNNL